MYVSRYSKQVTPSTSWQTPKRSVEMYGIGGVIISAEVHQHAFYYLIVHTVHTYDTMQRAYIRT